MGGVVKPVTQALGISKPKPAPAPVATPEPAAVSTKSAAPGVDESAAARRRARRGVRALLSEQRLSPEQGIGSSTLGAGPMQ